MIDEIINGDRRGVLPALPADSAGPAAGRCPGLDIRR